MVLQNMKLSHLPQLAFCFLLGFSTRSSSVQGGLINCLTPSVPCLLPRYSPTACFWQTSSCFPGTASTPALLSGVQQMPCQGQIRKYPPKLPHWRCSEGAHHPHCYQLLLLEVTWPTLIQCRWVVAVSLSVLPNLGASFDSSDMKRFCYFLKCGGRDVILWARVSAEALRGRTHLK